jgi:hypothetical protein
MDRTESLRREDEGWAAFLAAVGRVPEERREEPGVVPGWSVKDLLWHCAKWADWVRSPLQRIEAGTYDPDEDYQTERLNDEWAEDSKQLSWDEVERGAADLRSGARAAFEGLPQVTEDAISEFNNETWEHYAEHAAEIEAFVEGRE